MTATLASLAMRDLTLVDSLLDIVEELEESTEDSELLDRLFKIDNLATRMRRNGENLLVLAGQDSGDPQMEPVPLLDVARAAISEISDYERVRLGRLPELFIAGPIADDISHLLAELLDNATAKSPDHAQVVISSQPMADGRLLLTVEDEGIGIPKPQLDALNERLSGSPVLDQQVVRHMGLYVVSRIAHRHELEVQLEARAFRGMSAHVVVPAGMFSETGPAPERPERPAPVRTPMPVPPVRAAPAAVSEPKPQESRTDMQQSQSPVTAAGLPRRSAHRTTSPLPTLPAEPEKEAAADGRPEEEQGGGASKAERIRADLEGFLEGERAANTDE
ncbi:anti-sigma regulatory factor (Ser/Thr protein kinase) [Spinactinospora alkalitolerans]|uniref:histidine kinase n=1 Tax=Spinactinospora alkalitolerans TaxID=687207 RepID=A0A852TZM4_9ACTN|nr:ATP-binding protein [Spinactinospora alkalitolerans]NYE49271.1 anti-sigma regulatory factor (Ser/Thr protein kinase) [Spinactinospora alkalitolerans]